MKTLKSLKSLIIAAAVILNTAALCGPDINPVYPSSGEDTGGEEQGMMKATLADDEVEVFCGSEASVGFQLTGFAGTGDLTVSLSKTIEGVSVKHTFDNESGNGSIIISYSDNRTSAVPLYVVFTYGNKTCKESLLLCLSQASAVANFAFDDGSKDKDYHFMEYERYFRLSLNDRYEYVNVSVPAEIQGWLQVTKVGSEGKNEYSFHLTENPGNTEREGKVVFSVQEQKVHGASAEVSVTIRQLGSKMKGSMAQGLTALYNATQERGWKNSTNWGSDKPVIEWYGLTPARSFCGEDGRIVYYGDDELWDLVLFGNRVKGTIPDDFWNICYAFRKLDFSANYNNDVPSTDFTCERYLVGNTIPETIWNPNLQYIDFRDCGISVRMTSAVQNATNLQWINFRGCDFGGNALPSEITSLKHLKVLDLGNSNVSGTIPSNIGDLTELIELSYYMDEKIEGPIPDSFYTLKNLKKAGFSYTKVSGTISPKIGNLTSLEQFDVCATQMEGRIPEEFGLCKNLWNVYFSLSHFTNVPELFRYWPCYNGGWDGWAEHSSVGAEQFSSGYFWNWREDKSFSPANNTQAMQHYVWLSVPKWEKERYALISWTKRELFAVDNPEYNPVYPYAKDLQYPANEYYYDANLKVWTHPAYNGKAAKHYHVVNGAWTYDENFDWTSPVE